jgi:hypothetical protein
MTFAVSLTTENIVLFSGVYELQGARSDHIREPSATRE